MGFMGICIDFLAWPAVVLAYPMFASIRAIETGSKHHMRKLITYWTLFSLISLFEFAFVKIIEWIPCWSTIKLIAIFWLVMPQFDGACNAYGLIIRPFLRVDLQAGICRVYNPKEENKLRKTEISLDIAEKYIKENGVEVLEKLISSKRDCKEPDNSQREMQVLEPEEKAAAAISKQKEKDAAVEVKEMTPMEPTAIARHLEIPPLEEEWRCDLCKVKTTSEKTINAHLQGNKHKSNCESLKASKLFAIDKSNQSNTDTTKSKVGQGSQQKDAAAKVKKTMPLEPTTTTRHLKIPPLKEEWNCDLCEVKTTSRETLNAHLQGNKHKSKCESLKTSKLLATGKSNQGNTEAAKSNVGQGSQQRNAAAEVKEMTPMEPTATTRHLEIPPLKEGWNCDLCEVKTSSQKTLNAHLQGNKHKSKCESLKASKLLATGKSNQGNTEAAKSNVGQGSQLISSKEKVPNNQQMQGSASNQQFKVRCNVCDVKMLSEIDLASHLKGKRHLANIDEMVQFEGSVFKLQCDVCDVKLLSEIDLASHLRGKRHLANIDEMVQF